MSRPSSDGAAPRARLVLLAVVLVPLVALGELVQLYRLHHEVPTEDDWRAAAAFVSARRAAHDLVVVAPEFATQARQSVGPLMSLADFGRFDTSRHDRLWEVAWGEARAPESAGQALEEEARFGRVEVRRYRLPPRAELLFDAVAEAASAQPARRAELMIDHGFTPRLVIPVDLRRGRATLAFRDVPLDGELRLFGLVSYRSGRFDEGGPIRVTVRAAGRTVLAREIRNFDAVTPATTRLAAGSGELVIDVSAADGRKREFGVALEIRRPAGGRR